MVKIPVTELQVFLSKAKSISNDTLIPVLEQFVKMTCEGDVVTITKTNRSSFVVYQLDGCKFKKNFSLLLDEKMLDAAVGAATGETMTITFKEAKHPLEPNKIAKEVSFSDGVDVDVQCFAEDEKLYAEIPKGDKDTLIPMDQDIIESLFLASKCSAVPKDAKTFLNYIHLKPTGKKSSFIVGMNGTIMYYKAYKKQLPDIILELETVKALRGITEMNFYTGGNYHFFDAGKTQYGFIQTETKSPDFTVVTKQLDTSKFFSMNRKDLMRFCQLAIKSNPMSIIDPCYLAQNDDKTVLFDYEFAGKNIKVKMVFEAKKNKKFTIEKFLFNPKEMLAMIENLAVDVIQVCSPVSHNLFITTEEDKDYIGAIREIAMPNEQKTVSNAK